MVAKPAGRYPIFKVDEDIVSWGRAFERIIPEIAPRYFFSNPRFRQLGQVSSPRLVDWLGIYEEGDFWILTIVAVTIEGILQYLFLPLTSVISSDHRIPGLGSPAFGLETSSSFHGKRRWKVCDAFIDPAFQRKIFDLFLPCTDIPETHVNAYVQLQKSGIGDFDFHSKYDLAEPLYLDGRCELEYFGTGIRLSLSDYYLEIHQVLPTTVDSGQLEGSSQVVGWIDYSRKPGLRLWIGVLYQSGKAPSEESPGKQTAA